jgi:hypothetical protein
MKRTELDSRSRFITTTPSVLRLQQFRTIDEARKAAATESREHGTAFVFELKEKYNLGKQTG